MSHVTCRSRCSHGERHLGVAERLSQTWKLGGEGPRWESGGGVAHAEPRRPRGVTSRKRGRASRPGGEPAGGSRFHSQPGPQRDARPRPALRDGLLFPARRAHHSGPHRAAHTASAGGAGPPRVSVPSGADGRVDVAHSEVCGRPPSLAASCQRPPDPSAHRVLAGDPGGCRRVCGGSGVSARPRDPRLASPGVGGGGCDDRALQPARCWGGGSARAPQQPGERGGGLGTVCSEALPAPRAPRRPGGVGGGVGRLSQSSHVAGPQGPGRPGDCPLQAQVPRGQEGNPTSEASSPLSCQTDVIFL